MKYIDRHLSEGLTRAFAAFPAIILTGPRRAGKTTLLRHLFPAASYCLLEAPDVIERASSDPRGFLKSLSCPVILDEIQNVPSLFGYIRAHVDAEPEACGRWLLTGSQEAPLMKGVSESMASRAAVFQLLPMSQQESSIVSPITGGFPEVLAKPGAADVWFRSYVQTYLERDVRAITSIRDLGAFRRFIALVASRTGQMLNRTELAAPLGVSVPTISQWLSILEITGQIILVPPFYENFGKRLIKSPRLFLVDTGLACHLLGVRSEEVLLDSPFRGAIFESFVASEITKCRLNAGFDRGLYYFRDQQGLEIDFVVDNGNGRLTLLEAKASQTPVPKMAAPMKRLLKSIGSRYEVSAFVVHGSDPDHAEPMPLTESVEAIGVSSLPKACM